MTILFTAAGIALAGGAGLVGWTMASDAQASRGIVVGDAEAFAAAVEKARDPTTILLKPGYYPLIELIRKPDQPGPPIHIASADSRQRAVIGEFAAAYAPATVIERVDFERRPGQTGRRYLAFLRGSPRSIVRDSNFRGQLGDTPQPHEYGLMLRDCDDCRVESSRFSGLRYGIGFTNADRLAILRNEIFDMRTDGIRGEGADDLLIAGNVIGDFRPVKGDHADGIQLWTNNQTEVTRRVTVRGNLIARGSGRYLQGIFIRDTKAKLPFEQVDVSGNLVIGGNYNGIAVLSARGVTVADNIVAGYPDQTSWIRLTGAQDVRLSRNRATRYNRDETSTVSEAGNHTLPATSDPATIRALTLQWAAANKDLGSPGAYFRRLTDAR